MVNENESEEIPERILTRFFSRVEKGSGCWVWTAGKTAAGYGVIGWAGRKWLAHRLSWLVSYGRPPGNFHVCHTCDNPSCVRPSHLFLGTDRDNLRDMTRKGRSCGKFTDDDVRLVRRRCDSGETYASVARDFDVSYVTIRNIHQVKRYRHVE